MNPIIYLICSFSFYVAPSILSLLLRLFFGIYEYFLCFSSFLFFYSSLLSLFSPSLPFPSPLLIPPFSPSHTSLPSFPFSPSHISLFSPSHTSLPSFPFSPSLPFSSFPSPPFLLLIFPFPSFPFLPSFPSPF